MTKTTSPAPAETIAAIEALLAKASARKWADLGTIASFRARFDRDRASGAYTVAQAEIDLPVLRYMAGLR